MLRTSLLVVGLALIATLSPREAVAVAADRPLVQPGTPLRVVVLPLQIPRQQSPTRSRLQRTVRELEAWMARVSYGRLRIDGEVAPIYRVSRRDHHTGSGNPVVFRKAVSRADALGIRFGGALPMFVGRAPTACPRPFRPVGCADRPRDNSEYGDDLDVMGFGGDRFGAYPLAVLGLAPVLDAPPGRAQTAIQPLDRPQPTLLRLRTARQDWSVDSRIRAAPRYGRRVRLPRGGNVSAPVQVDPAAAATGVAASIASSPAVGSAPATAVQLAAGQSVTISGTTDPATAGLVATFQPLAAGAPYEIGVSTVPIGADGRFSLTWTPFAGRYVLRVRVPVERRPDGINFRMQTWEGHVRG